MAVTPLPVGTNVSDTVAGKEYSRAVLYDATGADAIGSAGTAPAATTVLGRLKAIADAITTMVSSLTGAIGLTASADNFKALTAGSATLSPVPKALYVTTGGTVIVEGLDGVSATFTAPDQSTLPIRPRKLTGGTASGIIGLY